MRQLSQLGVTQAFAEQQIPQFVAYWRERNVPRHSWESKFIKEVWRQWQQAEATSHRRRQEVALYWRVATVARCSADFDRPGRH